MPSAKTERDNSAPPEKRFSSEKTPLVAPLSMTSMHFCTLLNETPGLGSVAPSR